jgi:hypothetical protein
MQLGPVFVLSPARGGGTVLARILNCHPQLVIWGEHVGLINRLAEIDDMVSRVGHLMYPKTEEAIADFVTFSDQHLTLFEPWANPFDRDSFRGSCRSLIEKIFTRGLRPGQRWGFKEVRYHRVLTAQFLVDLFPDAQFVILTRDTKDVAVSSILAPWSLRWFWGYRDVMPAELAEAIIRDVTYALLVVEAGLDAVRTHLGPRCLHLDYRQLREPNGGFVAQLFGFLGLTVSESIAARIGKVLEVRAGASDRDTCFGSILSSAFIRERMATLVSEMRAQIARDGPDRSRLVAREGTGQYSFLAGDHTMRDRGGEFSSMF